MIGATVIKLIQQAKYMKMAMKRYKNFLLPGRYWLYDSLRAICLEDPQFQEKAKNYFHPMSDYSPRKAQIAKLLNKIHYFCNHLRAPHGQYQAIYVANNYDKIRETKLFSFTQNKILIICTCAQDMNRQLQDYAMFGDAYKMPKIRQYDELKNALEVSMIDRREFPGDAVALSAIAEATVAYNSHPTSSLLYKPVKEYIAFFYEDERIQSLMMELADGLNDDILNDQLPLCMQHGDLSKDNLIYGECDQEKAFWWIDWEHAGERIFFYDYFFYILNSMRYGDPGAYTCYINGGNDDVLKTYFSHFGLVFDPDKRWDYFMVYTICFLKERVCDKGYSHALERYCSLIKNAAEGNDGTNQ